MSDITLTKQQACLWFRALRDRMCSAFEALEDEATIFNDRTPGRFVRTHWNREEGGGGEMSLLRGRVFEKVGVNISTVHGIFSETMRKEMPHGTEYPCFWASGISLVAHMQSPLVPAVHMNTRMLVVHSAEDPSRLKSWFGGGADLTPMVENPSDTSFFHTALRECCERFSPDYYPRYKQWCDAYFMLKHRGEPRGVGGIFYDNLNTGNSEHDFAFTRAVGETLLATYPQLVRSHMHEPWTEEERAHQRLRRGRYVEFNLLYDRGTRFGLMTGGNVEAILMSLPPEVSW